MSLTNIKRWPAWLKISAVLVLTYLAFFPGPRLWTACVGVARCLAAGELAAGGRGLAHLALQLCDLFIWLVSVGLVVEGWLLTRKKAYALLLAYLLLCTVTAPLGYVAGRLAPRQRGQRLPAPPAFLNRPQPVAGSTHASVTHTINLPLGPLLLLAAIWFFCQADGVQRRSAEAPARDV